MILMPLIKARPSSEVARQTAMKIHADASAFWAVVDEVDDRLSRLNLDGSFTGFTALFSALVRDLPADFFETELVPTSGADEVNPFFVVLRPGPRLNAVAAALRALDVNEHSGPLAA
jgi:hypothetical protein